MPSLDSLLFSLIVDKEFIRNYLTNRFEMESMYMEAYAIVAGGFKHYCIKNTTNKSSIKTEVILSERDNSFVNDITNLPIEYLILILMNEHPKLFIQTSYKNIPYIKIKLPTESKTGSWNEENRVLNESFNNMNVDKKFRYFIFKYFGGLAKGNNKLKIYPFGLSYDWYKPFNTDKSFYEYLKKIYGGKFRKMFIMFFINGYDMSPLITNKETGLTEKLSKSKMKRIQNLFIKNKCKFT